MRINTFTDGSREKVLTFTSNGERTLNFNIPKAALVKSAQLELEADPLADKHVIRIGVVKTCSLEEFNLLEERLESIPSEINTKKPGWGAEPASDQHENYSHPVDPEPDSATNYAVIPIAPGTLVSATPGYFKREFDLVIIPNGTLEVDLSSLISSGIPVILMNPELAVEFGLGLRSSLVADINSLHVADGNNYIAESITSEYLRIEGTGPNRRTRGRRESRTIKNANPISIKALEVLPETSKVIIDTGIRTQGILIVDLCNKYAYIGFNDLTQIISIDELFKLFQRTIEWTAIGGHLTNLGYDVGAQASGWRKLGELDDCIVTPDFAELMNKYIDNPENLAETDGSYNIPITFYSDSPGILKILEVRVNCAFLMTITTFADGALNQTLEFDAINTRQTVTIALPRTAKIINAQMQLYENFTNERLANHCIDERDVHGVMVSSEYLVAQQFKAERNLQLTKISLNLAKLDHDTELDLELWRYVNNSGKGEDGTSESSQDAESVARELIAYSLVPVRELTETYSWLDITFENIILISDSDYWLVLRTKKGQLNWHADIKSPLGGLLRSSRDGGRNWIDHNMDGLFKIYYETEKYSPSISISAGTPLPVNDKGLEKAGIEFNGRFGSESNNGHQLCDFSEILIKHLRAHNTPSPEICSVPLTFVSDSIGTLELHALELVCEVPTLEVRDALESKTVSAQLKLLIGLLNELQVRVGEFMNVLPETVLRQVIETEEYQKLRGIDEV